jgi:hypothetical protein
VSIRAPDDTSGRTRPPGVFDDVEVVQEGARACRVRGKIASIPHAQAVKRPAPGVTGSLVIPRSLARERGLI